MLRVPPAPGQSPAARGDGEQTGTERSRILRGQVRNDAVFPLAPLSHRSLHQRRMAAALHRCHIAASLSSCPARALRVRSRRSDAAMRRVSIWGGMLPFPGRPPTAWVIETARKRRHERQRWGMSGSERASHKHAAHRVPCRCAEHAFSGRNGLRL